MGLVGTLPDALLSGLPPALPELVSLNLSGNQLTGELPPAWASSTLTSMDLSNNNLSGPLPRDWGSSGAFPALALLSLQGNVLSGPLPQPEWTEGMLPHGVVITLRPGNDAVCGALPRLAAALQIGAPVYAAVPPLPAAALVFVNSTVSTSYFMADGLFAGTAGAATSMTIVNTLGSCAVPCGRTATIKTNIFDLAWQNNITVAALVSANPQLPFNGGETGMVLDLPCYPPGTVPVCFGSDAAAWQFAGGHQDGVSGAWGAARAGAIVTGRSTGGNATSDTLFYTGSVGGGGGTRQPVFWFVDLDAELTVTGVTVRAGAAMRNVSVYVGSNATDVQANILSATNHSFAAGEAHVVTVDHPCGQYVMLVSEGDPLSLSAVQVWVQVGDAAYMKPVTTSSGDPIMINTTVAGVAVDRVELCQVVSADKEGRVWTSTDLGYNGEVQNVIVHVEGVAAGVMAEVFVADQPGPAGVSAATRCYPSQELPIMGFLGAPCALTGRYVTMEMVGQQTVQVCDMEVYLKEKPTPAPDAKGSASVVGIAVGCAVGGVLLLAFAVLAVLYLRWRPQHMQVQQEHAELDTSGKGGPAAGSIGSASNSATTDARLTGSGGARNSGTLRSGGSSGGLKNSGSRVSSGGSGQRELARISTFVSALLRGGTSPLSGASSGALTTDLTRFGSDWNVTDFAELELLKPIGEGSFGLVYMARYLQTTVAVKMLTMDVKRGTAGTASRPVPPSAAIMAALESEASIMAQLRHPNCVQYIGACLSPPCLIMEHCPKKSVDCIMAAAAANPQGPAAKSLSWIRLLTMALDTSKGLLYLHSRSPPVIHRDLKSPNLLVDAQWHVKVSDFNLSRAMEPGSVVSSFQITNPRWLAPEVLRGAAASAASDVFSLGVVLWELMTWELPWVSITNNFAIIARVTEGELLEVPPPDALPAGPLPPDVYAEYVALMHDCWKRDPKARASVDEVARRLRAMLQTLVQAAGGGPRGVPPPPPGPEQA